MSLVGPDGEIGGVVASLAKTLRAAGADALADVLIFEIESDIEEGKPLKTLAIQGGALWYGGKCLGVLP